MAVSGRNHESETLSKCIRYFLSRWYGCIGLASAIHGQICTATWHNKRRPLFYANAAGAAPPFPQSDRPLNPQLPAAWPLLHRSTRAHRSRRTSLSNFSPPRILSHAFRAKRRDATRPQFGLVQWERLFLLLLLLLLLLLFTVRGFE
jgi:hypothetical protein